MGIYGKRKRRVFLFRGILVYFNYNHFNPPGIHLVHARPDGGPVFKQDVSRRNINGILIRTRNSQTFLHFRRLPWYLNGMR